MPSRLFIEPLSDAGSYTDRVKSSDVEACAGFAPHRRSERLAWRAILYRELGAGIEISYNGEGAPQVSLPGTYIGVSHSARSVAVVVADHPTAVDIELPERDFARVAGKYLTCEERLVTGDDRMLLAAAWCAKECLYKLDSAACPSRSLRDEIFVESIDLRSGSIRAGFRGKPAITLSLLEVGDEIAVFVP